MKKDTSNILKWVIPPIIIVAVLLIVITLNQNELPYKLSTIEMLKMANNPESSVDKTSLELLQPGKVILIDLRQPLEYNLNHAEYAINIPAENILREDYLNAIKTIEREGNIIIIYSNIPQKASGAWMLLRQIGISNIRYYTGTYEQLISKEEIAASKLNEVPLIDTTLLNTNSNADKTPTAKTTTLPKTVIPKRVQPGSESGGGC